MNQYLLTNQVRGFKKQTKNPPEHEGTLGRLTGLYWLLLHWEIFVFHVKEGQRWTPLYKLLSQTLCLWHNRRVLAWHLSPTGFLLVSKGRLVSVGLSGSPPPSSAVISPRRRDGLMNSLYWLTPGSDFMKGNQWRAGCCRPTCKPIALTAFSDARHSFDLGEVCKETGWRLYSLKLACAVSLLPSHHRVSLSFILYRNDINQARARLS